MTEDAIFDLKRRKSKNFLLLNKSDTPESDSTILTKEQLPENQPALPEVVFDALDGTNSSEALKNATVISDSELKNTKKDCHGAGEGAKMGHNTISGSTCGAHWSLDLPPKVSSIQTEPTYSPSFYVSKIKNNEQTEICVKNFWKKNLSPIGSKGQWCPAATPGPNREVESFLGFKSVFSFL